MPDLLYDHPISTWRQWLDDPACALHAKLADIYGGSEFLDEPLDLLRRTIDAFARVFGDESPVFIVRATGRVNLLGMHVDHRGGSVNPIAIKEVFFVVEPRDDDHVCVRGVDGEKYPDESFSVSACLPDGTKIDDWDTWCHEELEKRKDDASITFSNYIRAGVLYFQHLNTRDDGKRDPAFRGMNIMIGSNVPPDAGLSSSSCMVLASGMVALHRNGVEMDPMAFCEHCGWAEWYVGTRGGFGDHAAIRFGQCNRIVHMTSFPFSIEAVPFPHGYRVVLADSMVEAKKQAGARGAYNTPIAAYALGLWLARQNYPQYACKLEHLRDINPKTLRCDEAEIHRILKSLPETAGRAEVLAALPDRRAEIEGLFRTHDEPDGGYRIRGVCMYGVAECARSALAVDLLSSGDVAGFGRLISLHHDGDRVARLQGGEMVPEIKDFSDARMDQLIADAGSGDPERVERAHIWALGGGYDASVPEVDLLVDLAMAVDGVMGAGLVGAGLGGSMIALVKADRAEQVVEALAEGYYRPRNLPVAAGSVAPVGGAGVLEV